MAKATLPTASTGAATKRRSDASSKAAPPTKSTLKTPPKTALKAGSNAAPKAGGKPSVKSAAKSVKTVKSPAKPAVKAASKPAAKAATKTVSKAAAAKSAVKAPAKKAPAAKKAAPAKAAAKVVKPAAKTVAKATASKPAAKTTGKAAPAKVEVKAPVKVVKGPPALVPKPAPSRPVLSEVVARVHRSPAMAASTLERLRVLLLEEQSQHVRQAEGLAAEAEALANEREPGDTQFDEESGEGDTLSVERERDLALSTAARQTVEDIAKALVRMDDGTYGYCEVCGDRIPVPRLEAIPWADQCVKCKSRGERRR
jgi:RNA polymerase-binding protein DksA